jgi:hypothetical protein
MQEEHDCPICYNKIDNNINVCITGCGHKFHTNCLLLCGSTCPMCRKNLLNNTTTLKMPAGVYTPSEYYTLMQERGITYDSLSSTARNWVEECRDDHLLMNELEETQKKREENKKQLLKNANPNKYKLFYGSK